MIPAPIKVYCPALSKRQSDRIDTLLRRMRKEGIVLNVYEGSEVVRIVGEISTEYHAKIKEILGTK